MRREGMVHDTDQYYQRTPRVDYMEMPAGELVREAHHALERVVEQATMPTAPVEVKMARDLGRLETQLEQAHQLRDAAELKVSLLEDTTQSQARNITELNRELEKVKKDRDEWEASSDEYKRLYDNLIAKHRKAARRR